MLRSHRNRQIILSGSQVAGSNPQHRIQTNQITGTSRVRAPSGKVCFSSHQFSVRSAFFLWLCIGFAKLTQGHIDHALSLVSRHVRVNFAACSATHYDRSQNDTSALPEGAEVQLDPTFNVDAQSCPTWEKIIAKALQSYGAFISDQGPTLAIRSITDINPGNMTWSSLGTPKGPSLSNLPWTSFRVCHGPAAHP